MLIQGRKIPEEKMAELQDEIQEFMEAKGMSQRVIPEDSPEYKSLWEDYMKGWVVTEEKNDECVMFRDRHCSMHEKLYQPWNDPTMSPVQQAEQQTNRVAYYPCSATA